MSVMMLRCPTKLYETLLVGSKSQADPDRIQDDLRYLVSEAPAALFGERENPLAKFYTAKRLDPNTRDPIRVRKTCRYYFCLSPEGECCTGCPKIKQ